MIADFNKTTLDGRQPLQTEFSKWQGIMSEFWVGLYLKTSLGDASSAFRRYLRENDFKIILEMKDIQAVKSHGNYDSLISFNLFETNN